MIFLPYKAEEILLFSKFLVILTSKHSEYNERVHCSLFHTGKRLWGRFENNLVDMEKLHVNVIKLEAHVKGENNCEKMEGNCEKAEKHIM